MPALSQKMQMTAAIAEHSPGKLYKRNRSLLKMASGKLRDFARTKRKGLPLKALAGK